jgi:hypothetical protein
MHNDILKLLGNIENVNYSAVFGFGSKVPVYRKFTHLYATLFFKILDKLNLDYYVFAGTSIGYVRNKKNVPWVDDYDIIIFEKEVEKFESKILPELNKLGFWCFKPVNLEKGGWHVLSKFGQCCFQCDIFFTKIDNGIIKNVANWGYYSFKNIHINIVNPKKYLTIDDNLTLPFFNNVGKYIEKEYGDVLNTCVFHINHSAALTIKDHYLKVYNSFYIIKNKIISNTKKMFDNHVYINDVNLIDYKKKFENNEELLDDPDSKVSKSINFLKYIKNTNAKILNIMDEDFLIFCPDIKFYFKNIVINFYMTSNIDSKNIILLNYIDNIFYSSDENITYLKNYDILLLNKPNMVITKSN